MGMWHQQQITNQKNVVVGKPKGKRPLCRSRHTWKDNIEMDQVKLCVRIAVIWLGIGYSGGYKINLCFHNRWEISLLATRRMLLDVVVDSSRYVSAFCRLLMVGWFSVVKFSCRKTIHFGKL